MLVAIRLWAVLTFVGLTSGMAGYAYFEGMSVTDAYVNAAMILSGMGPVSELKTGAGKIFAGSYAILSGLIVVIGGVTIDSSLTPPQPAAPADTRNASCRSDTTCRPR